MAHSYETRLRRVMDHIYDNPAGNLSLDELADVAAMSRFHFHRVFHAVTGSTVAQTVRQIRMYRAACLLVQNDWSIVQIAQYVGYTNSQSFQRSFGQCFGQTPNQFRQRRDLAIMPVEFITGEQNMYDVEIVTLPKRRVFAMAHIGPYPDVGRAFSHLFNVLSAQGQIAQIQGVVGFSHDDPNVVPEAELRSHAGVFMPDNIDLPEPLEELHMPAGRYAILHFKGPYAGLQAAYTWLFGVWLPKANIGLRDQATAEIYLSDTMDTAPDNLLTDICLPLVD